MSMFITILAFYLIHIMPQPTSSIRSIYLFFFKKKVFEENNEIYLYIEREVKR